MHFKETQLSSIKHGKTVKITLMGYHDEPFEAKVDSVAWGIFVQDGSGGTSTRTHYSPERIGQLGTGRIQDCQVVKSGCAWRWWRTAEAFLCVKTDVVMITSSRNKRRLTTEANRSLEAEHPAIKS